MADTALDVQTDSGKAERRCAWCGDPFSFGQKNRTLCSSRCKKAAYYSRNKRSVDDKQKEKNRTPVGREVIRRYKRSEKGRQAELAWKRNHAAARALSLLIMPIETPEL